MMKKKYQFSHRPMIRTKERHEGVLFTAPVVISIIVLALIILCCIFA